MLFYEKLKVHNTLLSDVNIEVLIVINCDGKLRPVFRLRTRELVLADLLALVCGVFCEFVTFPLVSWVRCGT